LSTPGDHRTAAGAGTAARMDLLTPPVRLDIGREMSIPSPGGSGQRHPAVAYGDSVYLLVWREGFSGFKGESDILALRVGTDGRPLDREPIPVCVAPGVQDLPTVAFCAGQFLVAWAPGMRTGDPRQVYALRTRRVGPDGSLEPQTHGLFGQKMMTWPALSSNQTDEFLLLWQEEAGDHFAVRGTRVSAGSDNWLDVPSLNIMDVASGTTQPDLGWARGARLGVAWTGSGYVVVQGTYATCLGPKGQTELPLTQLWQAYYPEGHVAAAAWGRGLAICGVTAFPDPWGWHGPGVLLGLTVTPQSGRTEWEALGAKSSATARKNIRGLIADGCVANCLDVSRWMNHPGWPGGMPGGLKHSQGDLWPSGWPAAAFNGRSLVVAWPRGHLVDNRRLKNRDIVLTRLLPGWAKVDAEPVPVAAGGTEESNPVLCAGPLGQTLLAYEKLTENGPEIRYRVLNEQPDTTPPAVVRVMPKSRTEMVVTFDEPIDEAGAGDSRNFRIDGLTVTGAEWSPDGRSGCREVILTTTPPQIGRQYTLRVTGIRDRSPAANAVRQAEFVLTAKPAFMQRSDTVSEWANSKSSWSSYPNPGQHRQAGRAAHREAEIPARRV